MDKVALVKLHDNMMYCRRYIEIFLFSQHSLDGDLSSGAA